MLQHRAARRRLWRIIQFHLHNPAMPSQRLLLHHLGARKIVADAGKDERSAEVAEG